MEYARARHLMEAELGDELVALDADGGNCFGFNGVATVIWQSLEQPQSIEALTAMLVERYDVDPETCRSDLVELLDHLQELGLVKTLS